MSSDPISFNDILKVMPKEGRRRILLLSTIFAVTAVLALVVVLVLPKTYDASALIVIDSNNMIKPLMEGRATQSVAEGTDVTSQIVLGKKIMREMLLFGGWVKPPPAQQPDARREDDLLNKLRSHIKIENKRDETIRISFRDNDPKRTYLVANKLAEIFLRESQEGKARASREAYEFIDKQVKDYGDKLGDIHQRVLKQYHEASPHPSDGSGDPAPRPTATAPRSKASAEELASLRAEEALLETQVARKSAAPSGSRTDARAEEQLRSRVLQLQADLDRLRTTYTDEHPDVKRVKRELEGVRAELERSERLTADRETSAQLTAQADDDVARAARARLEDVRRRIAAATGTPVRHVEPVVQRNPHTPDVIDPDMRAVGLDTTLSELLRRYEATREIYQDLLRRRDNARLAMELDVQKRGLSMHLQEAAEMPVSATSLRLMYKTAIGFALAVLLPLGLLLAIVRFDHRLRTPQRISRLVPLLGSISDAPTHPQKARHRKRELLAAVMVVSVVILYAVVFAIKVTSG